MRQISFVTILVITLLFGSLAMAGPSQSQIEQYRAELAKQVELDTKNVTASDRTMVEKWLKEAEVLLANGEDEIAGRRLQRVEFALDLIRAMVAAAEIRAAAEETEARAYRGPERTNDLKNEIQKLNRRKSDLQRELQVLR